MATPYMYRKVGQNPVKFIGGALFVIMVIVTLMWSRCSSEKSSAPQPTTSTLAPAATLTAPPPTPDPAVAELQKKIEELTQRMKDSEASKAAEAKPPAPSPIAEKCGSPCDVPQACRGLRDQQLWACLRLNAPGQ